MGTGLPLRPIRSHLRALRVSRHTRRILPTRRTLLSRRMLFTCLRTCTATPTNLHHRDKVWDRQQEVHRGKPKEDPRHRRRIPTDNIRSIRIGATLRRRMPMGTLLLSTTPWHLLIPTIRNTTEGPPGSR